jgi:hypothetical protein
LTLEEEDEEGGSEEVMIGTSFQFFPSKED